MWEGFWEEAQGCYRRLEGVLRCAKRRWWWEEEGGGTGRARSSPVLESLKEWFEECGLGRWWLWWWEGEGRREGKELLQGKEAEGRREVFLGSTGCSKEHFSWEVFSVSCQWGWRSREGSGGVSVEIPEGKEERGEGRGAGSVSRVRGFRGEKSRGGRFQGACQWACQWGISISISISGGGGEGRGGPTTGAADLI